MTNLKYLSHQRDESTRVWMVYRGSCTCSLRVGMFSMRRTSPHSRGSAGAKPDADGENNRRSCKRNEMFLMNENAARDRIEYARACRVCSMRDEKPCICENLASGNERAFYPRCVRLIECTCWNKKIVDHGGSSLYTYGFAVYFWIRFELQITARSPVREF